MPCIILDCAWFDFVRDTWYVVVVVEGVSLFILVLIRDALSLGSFLSLSLCVCVSQSDSRCMAFISYNNGWFDYCSKGD
jgi:hypothetical protein